MGLKRNLKNGIGKVFEVDLIETLKLQTLLQHTLNHCYGYMSATAIHYRCPAAARPSRLMRWVHANSHMVLMLFYVLLLIFIGLMSSARFWSRVQQFYEKAFDSWGWTDGSAL